MKDFNELVKIDSEIIAASLEMLTGDDKLNYLYFLRDEINKQVKAVKKPV
jgi:hypothetical protein